MHIEVEILTIATNGTDSVMRDAVYIIRNKKIKLFIYYKTRKSVKLLSPTSHYKNEESYAKPKDYLQSVRFIRDKSILGQCCSKLSNSILKGNSQIKSKAHRNLDFSRVSFNRALSL
ncbi:unnamed protein product [Vicia faba]|uniref:Uncharacterized protein n=1 Tax=Vicia faba TaxID=3906 RepID=A0AAV0ZI16_VICFA|nr:unnamed protein product [Vicia faba]